MAIQYAPGPRGDLLLGSLREFRRRPLALLVECAETYGGIFHLRLGPFHVHVVSDPAIVHDILIERVDLFPRGRFSREYLRAPLGNGLLTVDGSFHRQQRRLVQPAFHYKRVQAYGDAMVSYAEQMIARWQPGSVLDIDDEMMKLTLNIVAKTLFNADVSDQSAEQVGKAIAASQEYVNAQFQSALPVPLWLPIPKNRRLKQARRVLDGVIQQMIDEHKASGQDSGDLLSMLIAATDEDSGGKMSDAQLRDEAVSIFAAGHETTANTLTWTWHLLAQHPEVEQKLLQELGAVLNGRAVRVDDLPQLPYTNMVIKEAIRLYPAAWAFNREPVEDTTLGGYRVKKGEMILISPYVMHRLPQYFEKPDRFLPERWTEEFEKQLPRQLYIPFASGPHVCIGASFAIMEANLILATVARRWQLESVPDRPPTPQPLITLGCADGMWMKIWPRQSSAEQPLEGQQAYG
jgi:cytochrome P450